MAKKHLTLLGLVFVLTCSVGIWKWIPEAPVLPSIADTDDQSVGMHTLNRSATPVAERNSPPTHENGNDESLTRPNRKWLSPIISNVLNSKTTWNETGSEKKVTYIVETDFHHRFLRVEETYNVDPDTGEEYLKSYVPSTADTILVKLNEGADETRVQELQSQYGLRWNSDLLGTDILKLEFSDFAQTDRLTELVRSLNSETEIIAMAEPDYLVHAFRRIPNDPDFNNQAGFDFTPLQNTNRDIDAPEAWAIRTDASSIIVAVIDSGIHLEHEDLVANIWSNTREINNGVDDDNNGIVDDLHGANFISHNGDPSDDNEHGTLVAGVIGAMGNNGAGVAGVAWDVQLMALKFIGTERVGLTSNAIEAIQYAINSKVDIINNSWGGSGYSAALKDVLEQASRQGILIVTAAGNDGNRLSDDPLYPAAYRIPNQVVVGSSTIDDRLSSFSNYDEELVHILAPEGAYTTWNRPGNTYRYSTGTSLSTPYVSGALALLKAEFPGFSAKALISRLLDTAEIRDAFSQSSLSKGRLNVYRALTGESNIPSNDLFVNAQLLDSEGGSVTGSLTRSSLEGQEPQPFQNMDTNSVWYRWTSPRSDLAYLRIEPPGFQGALAVYTGESVNQLQPVISGRSLVSGETLEVRFEAMAGTTYYVQLGRVSGPGGLFKFQLALAPPNDQILNALSLGGSAFVANGSMALATQESEEAQIHPSGSGNSVWYQWTAPNSGSFYLSVDSNEGQTFASVFTGSPGGLSTVAFQNDGGLPNRLLFSVTANISYYFGVDSQAEDGGQFSLRGEYLESPRITVQPNDVSGSVGGEAFFNVGVLGIGASSYRWFHNDEFIEGETKAFLQLTNLQTADGGDYYVSISINGVQLRSRTVRLSVRSPNLEILEQPQAKVVTAGSIIRISVFAQPAASLTYSWFKDGKVLADKNSADLIIENSDISDTGYYSAELRLGEEVLTSREAFVRVVAADSVFTGTAWANIRFGSSNFQTVRQAGDYFFALAQEDNFAFSKDGRAWFRSALPEAGYLNWVIYGNGIYVMVADQGIYWASDPFSWQKASTPELTAQFSQIAFGNGVFIAIGSGRYFRSTDGKNWTEISSGGVTSLTAVVWADDKFIALGNGNQVLTSTDGNQWSQIGTTNLSFPFDLVYHDGEIWATRNSLSRSTDGIQWTPIDLPDSWLAGFSINKETGRKFLLTPAAYWEWEGDHWRPIQLVPEGLFVIGLGVDGDQAIVTIDGIPQRLSDYKEDEVEFESERLREAFFANGNFGAWSGDKLYGSQDGNNWNLVNTNKDRSLVENPMTFGNGIYVFSGASGATLSSLSEHNYNFRLLAFGNGVFAGLSGRDLLYSTDGANWTVAETVDASLKKSMIFANDKFLYMDAETIRTSTNGSSWTTSTNAIPPPIDFLAYGNEIYVGLFRNGGTRTSTDGITWQSGESISLPLVSGFVDSLVFVNDRFLATYEEVLFESTNGVSWSAVNQELRGSGADQLVVGDNQLILTTDIGVAVWSVGNDESEGPPVLRISGVTPGATVSLGEKLTFNVEAFSRSGLVSKIEVFENDALLIELAPSAKSFEYTVPTLGDHALTVKLTDSNGQIIQKTTTVRGVRNLLARLPGGGPNTMDITFFKGAFYGAGPAGIVFQSLDGTNWNQIQTPSQEDLLGFYQNDIGICAVGDSGDLLFSQDAIHWQLIPLVQAFWIPRQYEPSFLAIPTTVETLWLSLNGSDWYSGKSGQLELGNPSSTPAVAREFLDRGGLLMASPGRSLIESVPAGGEKTKDTVKLGNSVYEAVAKQGVFRTEDGISWEGFPLEGIEDIDRVTIQSAGNALFFIEEGYPDKRVKYFSGDGTTWEPTTSPKFYGNIVFRDGSFYCGNDGGFYRSSDGINWANIGDAPFPSIRGSGFHKLLASPIGFLTSSKTDEDTSLLAFSETGETWFVYQQPYHSLGIEQVVGGPNFILTSGAHWTYPLWGDNPVAQSENLISDKAVWGNGIFLDRNLSGESTIRKSDDGINWTDIEFPQWFEGNNPDVLFFDGEEAFWYFANSAQLLARSVDGIIWERKTFPAGLERRHQFFKFKGKLYAERYVSDDNGVTWTDSFPDASQVGLAKTETHLLATIRLSNEPTELHVFDGVSWRVGSLPDSIEGIPTMVGNKDRFFYLGNEWMYSSSDGSSWEIVSKSSDFPYATEVDDHIYFYGLGMAVREPSLSDLSFETIEVTGGEMGVGDKVGIAIRLRNTGEDRIQTELLNIEVILSQRAKSWGSGPDGYHASVSFPVQSLALSPGESVSLNKILTIPDTIRPGKYYVSGHIKNNLQVRDINAGNDFWLGDHSIIVIPERKLTIMVTGEGNVLSEKSLFTIPHKQSLQLLPDAYFGHEFFGWSGDVSPTVEIAELVMDSDKEVEATFTPRLYNVAISVAGNGSVTGSPESGFVSFGGDIKLEAGSVAGWQFLGWFGDRISQENVLRISVGRDLKLTARFGQDLSGWLSSRYNEVDLQNIEIGGLLGDPDRNGYSNLQEFLFGIDSVTEEPPQFEVFRDGDYVSLIYPRSLTAIGNERLEVWHSSDLSNWMSNGLSQRVIREEVDVEYVEARLESPGSEPVFFELRAVAE